MKAIYIRNTLMIFGAVVLAAACKVSRSYQSPEVNISNFYRDSAVAGTTSMAQLPWQQLFADTLLQQLIREGIDKNLDLQNALLKINEAAATLRQAKLAYYPTLSGGVQVTHARQSQAALNFPSDISSQFNLSSTTYQASLSASWEFNIWGQIGSLKRKALAGYLQTDAAKRAVQTQLVADIANNYFTLLALDEQLKITTETVENRKKDVETMQVLKENAVVTGAAVVQSEGNRYAAEVSIPDLKQQIRETENALSILLGRASGPVSRGALENQHITADLNTGLSAQLLQNRPDVQQAEMAFRAAFENVNVARSYFYPTLSITAQGGLSSLQLKNFFDKSIFYNLVGGLTQPIFNQGQNQARYRIAVAQRQEALNSFQLAIFSAGKEVSNSLYSYQNAVEKQQLRKRELAAFEKAVDYTKALLQYSANTNYTDVLTAEQSLLSAQLSGINDRLQELQAIVNLYRSLGGGWK